MYVKIIIITLKINIQYLFVRMENLDALNAELVFRHNVENIVGLSTKNLRTQRGKGKMEIQLSTNRSEFQHQIGQPMFTRRERRNARGDDGKTSLKQYVPSVKNNLAFR